MTPLPGRGAAGPSVLHGERSLQRGRSGSHRISPPGPEVSSAGGPTNRRQRDGRYRGRPPGIPVPGSGASCGAAKGLIELGHYCAQLPHLQHRQSAQAIFLLSSPWSEGLYSWKVALRIRLSSVRGTGLAAMCLQQSSPARVTRLPDHPVQVTPLM